MVAAEVVIVAEGHVGEAAVGVNHVLLKGLLQQGLRSGTVADQDDFFRDGEHRIVLPVAAGHAAVFIKERQIFRDLLRLMVGAAADAAGKVL